MGRLLAIAALLLLIGCSPESTAPPAPAHTARGVSDGVYSTPPTYADPLWEIQRTGAWHGKFAHSDTVIGRRAGFTSTSLVNDVTETGVAETTELVGTEPLEVVSSSTADSPLADAGVPNTGAQSVRITYIRASDGRELSTDVVLAGTTPVSLGAVRALSIQFTEVLSAGSGLTAAGNIDVRVVSGSVVLDRISASANRSYSGRHMIPAGTVGYVVSWHSAAVNNDQDVRLRMTNLDDGTVVPHFLTHDLIYTPANTAIQKVLPFMMVPPLAKVKLSTISAATGNTVRCAAAFEIVEVQQ